MKNTNRGCTRTCDKGRRDDSTGVEAPGGLEFNRVLGDLRQPLQSDPGVLSVQYELLHTGTITLDPKTLKIRHF